MPQVQELQQWLIMFYSTSEKPCTNPGKPNCPARAGRGTLCPCHRDPYTTPRPPPKRDLPNTAKRSHGDAVGGVGGSLSVRKTSEAAPRPEPQGVPPWEPPPHPALPRLRGHRYRRGCRAGGQCILAGSAAPSTGTAAMPPPTACMGGG